jgi:hypothetical protein
VKRLDDYVPIPTCRQAVVTYAEGSSHLPLQLHDAHQSHSDRRCLAGMVLNPGDSRKRGNRVADSRPFATFRYRCKPCTPIDELCMRPQLPAIRLAPEQTMEVCRGWPGEAEARSPERRRRADRDGELPAWAQGLALRRFEGFRGVRRGPPMPLRRKKLDGAGGGA